jgi:hypothetical protein
MSSNEVAACRLSPAFGHNVLCNRTLRVHLRRVLPASSQTAGWRLDTLRGKAPRFRRPKWLGCGDFGRGDGRRVERRTVHPSRARKPGFGTMPVLPGVSGSGGTEPVAEGLASKE